MAIPRTPIVNDSGGGMDGTVLDNTWKQELYDQIDSVTGNPISILNRQTGDVSNSGTGETTLKTYAIPAAKLATNGDSIRLTCWGAAAANTNSKTFKLYFGATVVATNVDTSATHPIWIMRAEITRLGTTAQVAWGSYDAQTTGSLLSITAPAETLSGSITVKMTGQSAVASSDITAKNWVVEFVPNA